MKGERETEGKRESERERELMNLGQRVQMLGVFLAYS